MHYGSINGLLKWIGPGAGAFLVGLASINDTIRLTLSSFINSIINGQIETKHFVVLSIIGLYVISLVWTSRLDSLKKVRQPRLRTTNAAFFGIGTSAPKIIIDFKNFGSEPAVRLKMRALSGCFDKRPEEPFDFQCTTELDSLEVNQENHFLLIQKGSPTPAQLKATERDGGMAFYVVFELEYFSSSRKSFTHRTIYYLEPYGNKLSDRWMLNISSQTN